MSGTLPPAHESLYPEPGSPRCGPTMPPAHEWLYLKNGAVVHAHSTFTGTRFVAECGAGAWATWYGTGSQDEYDTAAGLPQCKRCLPKVGASDKGRHRPSGIKKPR